MASASVGGGEVIAPKLMTDATRLLWGPDIKHDVFRRWTQGKRRLKLDLEARQTNPRVECCHFICALGFSLLLRFPLATILTFCMIIRKRDHKKF